ncbi:MAG: hypothetical protein AMXMBFR56_31810 [Polyangiaceae bacterium]
MTQVVAWSGDAASRARVRALLEQRGFALLRPDPARSSSELAARDPWEAATLIWGESPELVERQPIAPVPWGRSFASTSGDTPLHSDSQLYAGAPPDLQLMFCERAASRGGETTLLDTWSLLDAIERAEPELFRLLFHANRRIPFVFGDVVGPTVSLRRGALAFTHSPMPTAGDPIAERLQAHLERAALERVRPESGELLVVDNRRMLHGRSAFDDPERRFTRLLLWLRAPLPCPAHLRELCEQALALRAPELAELPASARRRLGLALPEGPGALRRRIVLEMLRGVPPGVLARRHGVDERELYAWRDRALAAAEAELGRDDDER